MSRQQPNHVSTSSTTAPNSAPPKTAPCRAWTMLPIGPYPTALRWAVLVVCSPILLPLVCATFPLLLVSRLLLRACRKRSRDDHRTQPLLGPHDDRALRCCEEGRLPGEEQEGEGRRDQVGSLLQRYLEDQMRLVGSVYGCDDHRVDFDDGGGGGGDIKGGGGGSSGLDFLS